MKPPTEATPDAGRQPGGVYHPTDPLAWLARAKSNLRIAEMGSAQPGVFLEDLCFEAQQAAEKAPKAVCVHLKLDFPKTHSLVILIDIIQQGGLCVPRAVHEVAGLTAFAVQARYPDWGETVTLAEYQQALCQAQGAVAWAEASVGERDP